MFLEGSSRAHPQSPQNFGDPTPTAIKFGMMTRGGIACI